VRGIVSSSKFQLYPNLAFIKNKFYVFFTLFFYLFTITDYEAEEEKDLKRNEMSE
jgi:hypothetical protein